MRRKRYLLKTLKITGISIASFLLLLFILPYLFPNTIKEKIKQFANQSITSKLDFSDARFSFFKHFPSLTCTLYDVSITGSAPFQKDTLIVGKELSFGINLFSLLSNSVKIDEIYLTRANVNVLVDKQGRPNYNIYKPSEKTSDTSSSETSLQLESIVIENSNINYRDLSVPMMISTQNLNYKGTGDFSKDVFDLATRLSVESFSLAYDGENYINKKKIKAKLVTSINTKSLSLVFQDNRVLINKLPVRIRGTFNFLQRGYNMDLNVESRNATLDKIISAIPPDMTTWIEDTKLDGDVVFKIVLKGNYDKQANQMPALWVDLKIHNGLIAYKNASQPLKNLTVSMNSQLPSVNMDSLKVKIDTLSFSLGKGYFKMDSYSVGVQEPYIETSVNADLDLAAWAKAIGLKAVDIRGHYQMNLQAKGQFARGQNPNSWRADTVITSIPSFQFSSSARNGYFRFASLPEPIHQISFDLNGYCTDGNYRHVFLNAQNIHFAAVNNTFNGFAKVTNLESPEIDANISGNFDLKDIEKFTPTGELKMGGVVAVDARIHGVYDKEKNLFPITNAKLSVADGRVQTGYFPSPIEHIKVLTEIQNTDGKLPGTVIRITPVSFDFEGQPFMLRADLSNPDNLSYDIVSKGTFNLGKLYKVFGVDGYDVSGYIKANVSLKGKQSDALSRRIENLDNSGTLQLYHIKLSSDLFPQPLIIQNGVFRFDRDKMWLEQFESTYGSTKFLVDGFLENVIAYELQNNAILRGKLKLTTDHLYMDEFTAFGNSENDISRAGSDSSGTGVVLIPKNVALVFTAKVNEADFNGIPIKDFSGQMIVDSGKIKIQQSHFKLADAVFNIDAVYEGVSPHSARFETKMKADSFSIAKAYHDIPMFRELATSASGVQGIVGMDYTLAGRLNQDMQPVLPSLTGGGVINLKKVKLKGFRLMNAVGNSTGKKELNDPDLSGINIKTTIKNNIITLERTKLRILGFRPRFEGQISLDGELNIKGRLGLPPFGIFGIPFTVSGTSEAPKVKLKKDKNGKVLQEKEDMGEDELISPSDTLKAPVQIPAGNGNH